MQTPNTFQNTSVAPAVGGLVTMGVAGALVTGSLAAARELRKVKAGTEERAEAATTVAKEALGGGLAVAAGSLVAKALFRSTPLGMLAMVAVTVGAKYAFDGITAPKAEAKAAPAAKTAKAK